MDAIRVMGRMTSPSQPLVRRAGGGGAVEPADQVTLSQEQPVATSALVRAADAAAFGAAAAAVPGPTAFRLIVSGPPGAGKSTHGIRLAQERGVPHVSMGNLLREEVKKGTDIGKQIAPSLSTGDLIDANLVAQVLEARLVQPDLARGFVIDGYPRRMVDVHNLDAFTARHGVGPIPMIEIEVEESEVVKRVENRRICDSGGHPVDVKATPPKVAETCDEHGTALKRRPDDTPETIHHRFEVYRAETRPVLDEYSRRGHLVTVAGTGTIDEVYARVRLAADLAAR